MEASVYPVWSPVKLIHSKLHLNRLKCTAFGSSTNE